ncbi:RNA polymerase sigma factor [Novosphingobium sp. PS1R-30]|uniref:RNA polymerase sigma factor n=1 Tax=Novosphingobium anseongense TaxID=3133436 RepID=A0ABU8RYE5_9SPHN
MTETAGVYAEPALPLPRASEPCTSDADAALMARVGRGDVQAFTVIVERYTPQLYRVCRRMLNGGGEAEDIVQEAFAKLWQTAPQWRAQGGGLPAWLHRVAVNRCLDRLRQFRVITTDTMPDVADEAPGPERALAMQRLSETVENALASLPGRHRAAIVLCYFEGLSNILAAQVLELNLKAMESLLFRARRSLRELLEARGVRSDDLELLQ